MAVKVHLDHIGMAFTTPGGTFRAVAPLNLSIESGRFVSLVGPSGCGKSTLFNIIAGLLAPTEGRVLIDGEDATGTIGRVGYMLQKDLLLPWRSVLDNVILGMEIQGIPLKEARERQCPGLTEWRMVEEERNTVLYEWDTTAVCEGQPIQWEMARLLFGRNTGYRVAYTTRAQLSAEARAAWTDWLRSVSLGR